MRKIHKRLKIELMSDLCAGSGYSYAGVIDSDVFYDEYGFPWIPARRLKGCMREAACLVCPESVEAMFGKTGDMEVRGIIVGNAYIEGHSAIAEELKEVRGKKRKESYYLSSQNILSMYTGIRAQTRINEDTGVAEENTLRYTRVVGQYDPYRNRIPLCFYAEVEYDEIYQKPMERIVKAVRNLGMNRNRGLGSVRCSLEMKPEKDPTDKIPEERVKDQGRVCLTYVLCNREPLLMSSDDRENSDSYISGKSILGTLAGAYLRRAGTKAESEEFRELFLNGNTIFTDANLTFPPKAEEEKEDAARWPDYYPAPLYLNRLKKTKVLINLLKEEDKVLPKGKEEAYNMEKGNLPKKLKTYYVCETEPNTYQIAEPEREIYYHNSYREQLYSQEALKEGQYFCGKIYASQRYARLLAELLEEGSLCFGKSKTAQYGRCELAAGIAVEDVPEEKICVKEGERVAVILSSDAIFFNESGYTVKFEEIKELTGNRLGIPYDETADDGSIVQTKEVTGYNRTWNLKRPGVPAVKAGSVLVYTIKAGCCWEKNLYPDEACIGERNLEGYGQVRIIKCRDMVYAACQKEALQEKTDKAPELMSCKPFLMKILGEQILERLIFLYMRKQPGLNLTSATVGRLNLMLRESLNEYKGDSNQALNDFCSRINSIKRNKERQEAFRLLYQTVLKGEDGSYELDIKEMSAGKMDAKLEEMKLLLKQHGTDEEYQNILAGIWGIYMETILTYHKYLKKQEGGD